MTPVYGIHMSTAHDLYARQFAAEIAAEDAAMARAREAEVEAEAAAEAAWRRSQGARSVTFQVIGDMG